MLIVGLYAALAALLMLALAIRVMWLRDRRGVGLGSGGDADLARAIRVHANAVEYVPLALVLLTLVALAGARPAWLHVYGIVLIAARLLHAFGLSRNPGRSFGRAAGAGLTVLVILAMAIELLVHFAHGQP